MFGDVGRLLFLHVRVLGHGRRVRSAAARHVQEPVLRAVLHVPVTA